MILISIFLTVFMVRTMVEFSLQLLRYMMAVNRYRMPEPSWRDEALAFLMTVTISAPIIHGISIYGK